MISKNIKEIIAKKIKEYYKYADPISLDEINLVIEELDENTTEDQFYEIIRNNISNTIRYCFDSVDTTISKDLLKQIRLLIKNG